MLYPFLQIWSHVYMCIYIYLYYSAWGAQRVWLEYNYCAGSFTPVVAFDLVVISQWLVVIPQWLEVVPQWLVVIPQQGKFKAPQSLKSTKVPISLQHKLHVLVWSC